MVTEDYVSFETAKLLKEKGFNCEKYYISQMFNENGEPHSLRTSCIDYYYFEDFDENDYICPTLQMAMKWLREVHKIFISIQQHIDMSYVWYIYEDGAPKGCDRESHNNTYEEACEEAIKYCLKNLI